MKNLKNSSRMLFFISFLTLLTFIIPSKSFSGPPPGSIVDPCMTQAVASVDSETGGGTYSSPCGPTGPVCGNGVCEAGETVYTCCQDCHSAVKTNCSGGWFDGVCCAAAGENITNCPGDCSQIITVGTVTPGACNATIPFNTSPAASAIVEYRSQANPTQIYQFYDASKVSHSVVLNSLAASTTYDYQIRAGTSYYPGTCARCAWVQFTTLGAGANTAPVFTQPTSTAVTAAVGSPFSLAFAAQDSDACSNQITLSVVSSPYPSWLNTFTAPTPTNSVTYTFTPITGRPIASDAGTYTLKIRATDNAGLYSDKTVTITVVNPTFFQDVTSTNLPVDTNVTPGADVADIDGDGDLDLAIAHNLLSSNVGNTKPGVRILLNHTKDATPQPGVFTDVSRLPAAFTPTGAPTDGKWYGYSVRFGHQFTGATSPSNPLLLFLSHWRIISVPSNPWPCDVTEEAIPYRLVANASGYFSVQEGSSGYEFIMRGKVSPTTCSNPIYPSYANDIEVQRTWPGQLSGYFANMIRGETIGSPARRWSHWFGAETFSWSDSYNGTGVGSQFQIGGTPVTPVTGDIEFADVDGDGDLDVVTAGGASYSSGNISATYNYPPKLWLTSAGTHYQSNLAFVSWNSTWSNDSYVQQKAAFADLNGDGRQDLILVDIQHGLNIYRNTRTANAHGNISFAAPILNSNGVTASDTKEVIAADIDKDGKPDLILIGNGYRRAKVLINASTFSTTSNNPITFTDATDSWIPSNATYDCNGGLIFDMGRTTGQGQDLLLYCNGQNRLFKNMKTP